ncbi:MAG: hypothetical protein JWN78_2799, partial [Bacteroidota bacterium]|nr:hypothetical protein [Bacteroidota bacterium]
FRPEPLYVHMGDEMVLSASDIFSKVKDTLQYEVTYSLSSDQSKVKDINYSHRLIRYGRDTLIINVHSQKCHFDSTLIYSSIFVAPAVDLNIHAKNEDLYAGDTNTYTINIDSSLNLPYEWTVDDSSTNSNVSNKPVFQHAYKNSGAYAVNFRYKNETDSFLSRFPYDYFSSTYDQVVLDDEMELISTPEPIPPAYNYVANQKWLWAFLFLIISCLIALIYIWYKKRKAIQKNQNEKAIENKTNGDQPPFQIPFRNKEENITPLKSLQILSEELKKTTDSELKTLDIKRTILRTIKNNEFISPFFKKKKVHKEYLFLVDHSYANSQQFYLFSYLLRFFLKNSIRLDFYYYYQVPDKFYQRENDTGLSVHQLKDIHYNANLIFITDGRSLLEYNKPEVKKNLFDNFSFWQNRILISTIPFNDWGSNERILSSLFKLIPADITGLLDIVKLLNEETVIPDIFSQNKYATYDSKYVEFNSRDELIKYLDDDEDLFQWLCALAVYPKINWNVTLEIGKTVLKDTNKINYETLLKFSRIKWMAEGKFSSEARLMLLKNLSVDNEIKARTVLLGMLDEIKLDESASSFEEKLVNKYINSFILYGNNPDKYENDEKIKNYAKNFLVLYEQGKFPDIPFRIYIEKNEKEDDRWNTPVQINNKNVSIREYLKNDKEEKLNKFSRSFWITSFLLVTLVSFTAFLYFKKNLIVNSPANKIFHLVTQNTVLPDSSAIYFISNLCLKEAMGNSSASLGIEAGDSIIIRKLGPDTIHFFDNKRGSTDSIKVIDTLRIPIPKSFLKSQSDSLRISLMFNSGTIKTTLLFKFGYNYHLELLGRSCRDLYVNYHPGYRDDTIKMKRQLLKWGYHSYLYNDNLRTAFANYIVFGSHLSQQDKYEITSKLLKAGFPLRSIDDQTEKNISGYEYEIEINGDRSLDNAPVITEDSLKCLFLGQCKTNTQQQIVHIYYNPQNLQSKVKEFIRSLNSDYNVSVTYNSDVKASSVTYFTNRQITPAKNLALQASSFFNQQIFSSSITELATSVGVTGQNAKVFSRLHSDSILLYLKEGEINCKDIISFKSSNGLLGYKDVNENVIIKPQYDVVTKFTDYCEAMVYAKRYYKLIINTNGRVTEKPVFNMSAVPLVVFGIDNSQKLTNQIEAMGLKVTNTQDKFSTPVSGNELQYFYDDQETMAQQINKDIVLGILRIKAKVVKRNPNQGDWAFHFNLQMADNNLNNQDPSNITTTFNIDTVYFMYDKTVIRPEDENKLEKVLLYLKYNENDKLDISGRSDCSSSSKYSLILSQDKAASVLMWFMQHGVSASRLISRGWGESDPIVKCNCDLPPEKGGCTKEQKAKQNSAILTIIKPQSKR